MPKSKKRAVVLCTDKRGVFFGYTDKPFNKTKMTLSDARMCVLWSESIKGVLGLAATGPDENCRVTPKVTKTTLEGIHAEFVCTPDAIKEWEKGPWGLKS